MKADALIRAHYGFTAEELDLIANYDIKCIAYSEQVTGAADSEERNRAAEGAAVFVPDRADAFAMDACVRANQPCPGWCVSQSGPDGRRTASACPQPSAVRSPSPA